MVPLHSAACVDGIADSADQQAIGMTDLHFLARLILLTQAYTKALLSLTQYVLV